MPGPARVIAALVTLSLVGGCEAGGSAIDSDIDCIGAYLLIKPSSEAADHDGVITLAYYTGKLEASSPSPGWEAKAADQIRELARDPERLRQAVAQCDANMLDESRTRLKSLEAEIRKP